MDPRHPELAVARIKELIKQYDNIEERMAHATTSAQLSQTEREGSLVIQEICLVAPRIHEAMMQTSRNRRYDLTHGVVVDMSKYEIPTGATGEEEGVVVEPTDQIIVVNEAITEEAEVVKKPKKKTTRKKKTTKKKADK